MSHHSEVLEDLAFKQNVISTQKDLMQQLATDLEAATSTFREATNHAEDAHNESETLQASLEAETNALKEQRSRLAHDSTALEQGA